MKMLLVLLLFLIAPLSGCVTLDDLASGESWITAEPPATEAFRYAQPTALYPLADDEIATSDEAFKSFNFSLTPGSIPQQDQKDLHKANLLSILTNKVSRGSITPWEGSIELGQQMPSTSIWLTSLEMKYEPDLPLEVDSDYVPMGTLGMALIDDEAKAEVDSIFAGAIQNPLGLSTG